MGVLETGEVRRTLRFHIAIRGGLGIVVYSVDHNNAVITAERPSVAGPRPRPRGSGWQGRPVMPVRVGVTLPSLGAEFDGVLQEDGDTVSGFWTLGDQRRSGMLRRVQMSREERLAWRPQEPVGPLPYLSEELEYTNPDGGHTLAGTLTKPASGGPFPAVILISGSSPHDRDYSGGGHRTFLVLADRLTRNGVAVLRFDDRGTGASTGDFGTATPLDFASDVHAGVAYLKTRHDVDPGRIGLAGHSEGGMIAPMVAAESTDVSYIALLAAPGMKIADLALLQAETMEKAAGVPEETVAKRQQFRRALNAVRREAKDPAAAEAAMIAFVRTELNIAFGEEEAERLRRDPRALEAEVWYYVSRHNSAWTAFMHAHDPADDLVRVTVSVLAINGDRDLQIPHRQNLGAIEAALRRGGNTDYEIHVLPNINHNLQYSEDGTTHSHQINRLTLAPEVLELVVDWIVRKTNR